jgi:hypothetical protein
VSSFASIASYTVVTMVCWQDDSWFTGKYNSNRWFYVNTPSGSGFIHSSWVAHQGSVDRCSTAANAGIYAADWAAKDIGQTSASSQEHQVLASFGADGGWGPGPYGEWSGDCWRFASLGWMEAGIPTKTGVTAYGAYQYYLSRGRVSTSGTPPAGAVIFYTGVVVSGRELGHAGISIGNGLAVSTTGLDGAGLGIRSPYSFDGLPGLSYRGYVSNPRP